MSPKARLKRGKPLDSMNQNSRKIKINGQNDTTKESHMNVQNLSNSDLLEGINKLEIQENEELSINSSDAGTNLNRSK